LSAFALVGGPLALVVAFSTPASATTGVYFYPLEEFHTAGDQLNGVACPSGGPCAAVGSAAHGQNHTPLILLQRHVYSSKYNVQVGWSFVEPALPTGGAAGPDDSLSSVSCNSPQQCFAVGEYDLAPGTLPLEYTGPSRGPWHVAAQPVSLPPDHDVAPVEAGLSAVSCNGSGFCLAVGNYWDNNGGVPEGMAVFLLGQSAQAFSVPPPRGAPAGTSVTLNGVSCIKTGCVVVGEYTGSGDTQRGMAAIVYDKYVTGCAGEACVQPPFSVPAPTGSAGISTTLTGVSCVPGGTCLISGYDINGSTDIATPMTSTMVRAQTKAGVAFHSLYQVAPHETGTSQLNSIWCTSSTDCAAVGTYKDSAGDDPALLADLVPAHGWLDAGYTSGYGVTVGSQLDLTSIACWAKDDCATVGFATAPNGTIFPIDAVSAAPPG